MNNLRDHLDHINDINKIIIDDDIIKIKSYTNFCYLTLRRQLSYDVNFFKCSAIAKYIVDHMIYIDAVDKWGITPIIYAATNNDCLMVKYLIDKGAKIYNPSAKLQIIHFACALKYVNLIKLLVDNQVDLEVPDKGGMYPIHYVCCSGLTEILQIFIDNGVKLDTLCKDGSHPIHLACRNNHKEIIQLLIDNKVDTDIANNNGWKPIHNICLYGTTDTIMMLLNSTNYTQTVRYNDLECNYVDLMIANEKLTSDNIDDIIYSIE